MITQDEMAFAIEELELDLTRKEVLHLKKLLRLFITNYENIDEYSTADHILDLNYYTAFELYTKVQNQFEI